MSAGCAAPCSTWLKHITLLSALVAGSCCAFATGLHMTPVHTHARPCLIVIACVHTQPQVQQDELEKQRLQMMQQQMPQQSLSMQPASTHTSGGMMSLMMGADGTTAGSGMMMMPTATFAAAGQPSVSMAGVAQHQQHQSFSMPSMHATDCSLAGSVSMGQSAQSLLQHSLSASLNAASVTAAVGAATLAGCPDLPQVRCVVGPVSTRLVVCPVVSASADVLRPCLRCAVCQEITLAN